MRYQSGTPFRRLRRFACAPAFASGRSVFRARAANPHNSHLLIFVDAARAAAAIAAVEACVLFRNSGTALALIPFIMATLLQIPEAAASRKHLPLCVLDDDRDQVDLVTERLDKAGFPAVGTTNPQEALQKIRAGNCRMVLCDLKMPSMDGFAFLQKTLQCDPGIYVILVTGFYAVNTAIDAIKRGAYDFISKPIDFARLEKTLDDLAAIVSQRAQVRGLEEQLLNNSQFQGIIGRSPAMLEVFDLARKVARHFTNVLIGGPTGAGKELVAHALHQLSPVAQQRFAVCNCSAIVDTLLESQLFGHIRGSFTGATDTRAGLFEYANGGTVFLDEISETSPPRKPSCSASFKIAKFSASVRPKYETSASSRPPIATCAPKSWPAASAKIFTFASTPFRSACPASPTARRTFRPGPVLPEEIQRGLQQIFPRPHPPRANRPAPAPLARKRPRTGKRDLQRGAHFHRQFHRRGRPARTSAAPAATRGCGRRQLAAVAAG